MTGARKPVRPLQPGEWAALRHRKDRLTYYLVVFPSRRQVECLTSDWQTAKDFLEKFKSGGPVRSPLDLRLGDILSHMPAQAKPMKEWRRRMLFDFWKDFKVRDVNEVTLAAFRSTRIKKNGKPVKDGSVRLDVAEMGRWIRAAGVAIDPAFEIDIELPPNSLPRERWVRRTEMARLFWAVRGRVWEPTESGWRQKRGKRVLREADKIAERKPFARYFLTGLYTASRLDVVAAVKWLPGGDHGHIEVKWRTGGERWRVNAKALLYRQGPESWKAEVARYPKRSPAAVIVPKLIIHMVGTDGTRGWRAADREAFGTLGHVVHDGTGERITDSVFRRIWAEIVEDAGLGPDVVPHTMRHTSITHYLERGATPKEVAELAGLNVGVMLKVYAHVEPEFTVPVADAVDRAVRADPATRRAVMVACAKRKAGKERREAEAKKLESVGKSRKGGGIGNKR